MKTLNTYILEKLKLSDLKQYNYFPKDLIELCNILTELIKERGFKGNYNDIDTSEIKDMSFLFAHLSRFNGDISQWNVSNVETMESMFDGCTNFNCDLSEWDVSKVENMDFMFYKCKNFEGKGLDKWDLTSVERMERLFEGCENLKFRLDNWANCPVFDRDITLN